MLVLMVNLVGRLYDLRHGISFGSVMDVLVAAALIPLFVIARQSTVTVQDRVIRLEMRLRLAGVLPADLQPRIPEFTVDQLVSLRFASDAELPGTGAKSPRRKDQRSQSHQAIGQGLAGGLSAGVVGQASA